MLNFPTKILNTIKRYLLREQEEVEKNLKEVEEGDPVTAPSLAEPSEPGTDSWMAESHISSQAILGTLKNTASNIKKALFKIKDGTYGRCERCSKRIETRRLLAMPTATHCLSCSKKISKT